MLIKILFIFSIAGTLSANKLDLSWSGWTKENFFRNANSSFTRHIEKVKELNLQGNLFDSFSDCSAHLDKLESLDLSQNQLQRFFFVCKNGDNLYNLNVSHNRLPFLNETALTQRISKLQILDLSFNVLQKVTEETFQHLKHLHFLKINSNPINNNIKEGSFKNLISLVDLDLRNISASKFSPNLFTPLINLKHLKLGSNPIEVLPLLPPQIQLLDISETNVINLNGIDIPYLRTLTMNYMPRLESFDLNQLSNLKNLSVLLIENCPRFKNLTFKPPNDNILPEINRISIKNCSIDNLGPELQTVMQRTSDLNLEHNPWYCDCRVKWILSLNSTKNHTDEMKCKMPPQLRGKHVFEIHKDEFECSSLSIDVNLMIWICLGVTITVAVIATTFYITRGSLRHWRTRFSRSDTVTYSNMIANANENEKIIEYCDITDYP